jgi:hypothetical protein
MKEKIRAILWAFVSGEIMTDTEAVRQIMDLFASEGQSKASKALRIGGVRHSVNFHAKAMIKKLTSRPHLEDDEGYYDMIADEKQMIEIVEQYLTQHYA